MSHCHKKNKFPQMINTRRSQGGRESAAAVGTHVPVFEQLKLELDCSVGPSGVRKCR